MQAGTPGHFQQLPGENGFISSDTSKQRSELQNLLFYLCFFDHEFPHGLLTKMDSFLKDFLMDSLLKSYKLSQTYKIMDWLFQKCPRPLSCLATSPAWALLEEKSFNPWPETFCFIQKEKLWHLKCSRDGKKVSTVIFWVSS